jgi:protein-S-isoprenylcysteine O-methyltransferase Ste14
LEAYLTFIVKAGEKGKIAMNKARAVLGSAVFLAIAPGIFAGFVPWWLTHWNIGAALFGFPAIRILGAILIALGIPVLLDSFARFALQGLGTPAPVFPTRHLVVKGFYRFVRNPIYVAGVSVILGQGMLFGHLGLVGYGAAAWLASHLFVVTYEEPTLRKQFGAQYETYCANVHRWRPRIRPWREEVQPI